MRKVRRKTVEPAAKSYLLKARDEGIKLSWNHYEAMLPQDGFSILGLSCFECLQGPCRLNPFEQSEVKTVCGLTKDQLVLNSLKRLLLADNSVMQAAMMLVEEIPAKLSTGAVNEEILRAKAAKWEIKGETNEELAAGFALELAKMNLSCFANEVSNLDDLKQLASYRADLMALANDLQATLYQPAEQSEGKFGLGLLKPETVNICLEGVSSLVAAKLQAAVQEVKAEAKNQGADFNLLLVGDVMPGSGINTVTNAGGVELAILTGLVDLYLTGEAVCSRGRNAAASYHTVQQAIKPTTSHTELKQMLSLAAEAYTQRNQSKVQASDQLAQGTVGFKLDSAAIKNQQITGVCLVGGGSNVKVASDESIVSLVEGLASKKEVLTLTYGNGAATLGKYGCLKPETVTAVGGELDAAALVEVVAELNSKKVVAVFPELTCSRDLQIALALAAVGAEVITGIKLPVDGDTEIAQQVSELIRYCEPAQLVNTVLEIFNQ